MSLGVHMCMSVRLCVCMYVRIGEFFILRMKRNLFPQIKTEQLPPEGNKYAYILRVQFERFIAFNCRRTDIWSTIIFAYQQRVEEKMRFLYDVRV